MTFKKKEKKQKTEELRGEGQILADIEEMAPNISD